MKIDPKHLKRQGVVTRNGNVAKRPGLYELDKKSLQHHLNHGSYSMISAGNPHDAKTGKQTTLSPEENNKRHEDLKSKLKADGAIFHEAVGHYGSPEKSLMVHHTGKITPEHINKLGKHYEQHSVFHSSDNNHRIHYTHGADEGSHHKGQGHQISDHHADYYTHVPKAGKFQGHMGNMNDKNLHNQGNVQKSEESKRKLSHYIIPLAYDKHAKIVFDIDHDTLHKCSDA